jgi:hypothetical protein
MLSLVESPSVSKMESVSSCFTRSSFLTRIPFRFISTFASFFRKSMAVGRDISNSANSLFGVSGVVGSARSLVRKMELGFEAQGR